MVNHLLVSLVNSVIGAGKPTSGDNFSYNCPFCNHYKPKLEINFKENEEGIHHWHCWVCNKKGKKLVSLFKAVSAPDHKIQEPAFSPDGTKVAIAAAVEDGIVSTYDWFLEHYVKESTL